MSSQVHADPVQLREFAAHLGRFGSEMGEEISKLRAHFDSLDWQDSVRERFADEVAQLTGQLGNFLKNADDTARLVNLKAVPLEQYNGTA